MPSEKEKEQYFLYKAPYALGFMLLLDSFLLMLLVYHRDK